MKRSILVFTLVAACTPRIGAEDLPKEDLSDEGFEVIFDGKSLAGWHVSTQTGHSRVSMHTSGGKWRLEDGAIVGSQDIPGNGGIILTDRKFGDFEVIVEMKSDYGPDSGLFLRSNERGQAYQYMVDYHDNGNLAGIYGEGLPGGLHLRNYDITDDVTHIQVKEADFSCPITAEQWPELWTHGERNELRARIAAIRRESSPGSTVCVSWTFRTRTFTPKMKAALHCRSTAGVTLSISLCGIGTCG